MAEIDIVGIGSAWVNRIATCNVTYLKSIGIIPGSVCKVDAERYRHLCDHRMDSFQYVGGSVANTLVALANLSSNVGFVGKASSDGDGLFFLNDLESNKVAILLPPGEEGMSTSGCLYYQTGDGLTTKVVHVGASKTLGLADMSMQHVIRAQFLLVEADILDMPMIGQWLISVLDLAKKNNTKIVFILSNKYVVSRHREILLDLLSNVDYVAGNEVEFEVLANTQSVDSIMTYCAHFSAVIVMTRAENGAVVFHDNQVYASNIYPGTFIDATAAGDYYLAGFLHGVLRGVEFDRASDLGSMLAAKICSERGSRCFHQASFFDISRYFLSCTADVCG